MAKEIHSLQESGTWVECDLPEGRAPISAKWVFKIKRLPDGRVERYKARLVARGFSQKYGVDYTESFSPVIRYNSLRTLLAKACRSKWHVYSADVETAYLNGILEEELYLRHPGSTNENPRFCRLIKGLYGLKQAGLAWNTELNKTLSKLKFIQYVKDPCMYRRGTKASSIILAVYVDDLVITGHDKNEILRTFAEIGKHYKMTKEEEIKGIVGLNVIYSIADGFCHISCPKQIDELQRTADTTMKNMRTPMGPDTPKEIELSLHDDNELLNKAEQSAFRSTLGMAMFMSTACRPDISFAVNNIARGASNPTQACKRALEKLTRYLISTRNLGVRYDAAESNETICGIADASFGGELYGRRSTSGYTIIYGGGPVVWASRRQRTVALSTLEAEYRASSECARELLSTELMIKFINFDEINNRKVQLIANEGVSAEIKNETSMKLYNDNEGAISVAHHAKLYERNKHWAIVCYWLREQVQSKKFTMEYVNTKISIADMLTKALATERFEFLRSLLGMTRQGSERTMS
jgi:hypothetical protein